MPGKLYLIPSSIAENDLDAILPLWNQRIINSCDVFIVEELRTARRFLKKAGLTKAIDDLTFWVLNEHTQESETAHYLDAVFEGKNIGLLSEAGLPCIADPGSVVVRMAQKKNIEVCPLVGASSIFLTLMASGLNGQNFAFMGYLPIKKDESTNAIRDLEKIIYKTNQTQIFIEAPYRNNQLLDSLLAVCRPETLLCIATELLSENQCIKTRSIKEWAKHKPDLHKKNTVFAMGI